METDSRPGRGTVMQDALGAARLVSYLRRPLTVPAARAILAERLTWRERDFLRFVRRTIFDVPASPYRHLLRSAGCEFGDLQALVDEDGLEAALRCLFRAGVYLTVEELKGRRPVRRGSAELAIDPAAFGNPVMGFHLLGRSSGSRGPSTRVRMDLRFIRDRAVNALLTLDAQGGAGWRKAVWADPGGCLALGVRFSLFGQPTERTFSLVDPSANELGGRYRWTARAIRLAGLAAGARLPTLGHAPLDRALEVATWLREVLRAGGVPHVWTYVSPAVRLAQAAREAGLELPGARFTITGEPITATRLATIRSIGAEAVPDYGSSESGFIAFGCLAPTAPDDLHLFQDLHALIQVEPADGSADLPNRALLVSAIRLTAPVVLLNVSLGDQATLENRRCGCPLDRLGWTGHLSQVRSYEKLTAAGMTFLDLDVIRILEELLPTRFGGGPTDYQLVEQERPDGRPTLRLLVHPRLGPLDGEALAGTLLDALAAGPGAARVMAAHWREAGLLAVERRPPLHGERGKVLHLLRQPVGGLSLTPGTAAEADAKPLDDRHDLEQHQDR